MRTSDIMAQALLPIIATMINEENIQLFGDKLFDLVEQAVASTSTPWDDALVLPLIMQFRKALNIPDLPDA